MNQLLALLSIFCLTASAHAQTDTVNYTTGKLNSKALKEGAASYAVYFTDSLGNRITSADIWDRSVRIDRTGAGAPQYYFDWKWYRKDTLIASVQATGNALTLQPFTHTAEYTKRGNFSFQFDGPRVTIPAAFQKTAKDSAFQVVMDPPGFEFPMDLELFPLLPFKKQGQTFAMAFYEPGSPKSAYYKLTVTGLEDLPTVGGQSVNCWILRIDYATGSYADFWI
ncbi:MAG TPA: hypothetical protein VHK91_04170, partial [Flavisolibacter sp.]|nr:hypothetical protein [Flavisolibacter sp.]